MEPSSADHDLHLKGPAGRIHARYYPAEAAFGGVILVGGVGGGFDSPAMGLYDGLASDLPAEGLSVLRVSYRNPTHLDGSVVDVRAGIAFLREQGLSRIGLVGHSFGGAVVIRAAVEEPAVETVVTLATQGFGTESVNEFAKPLLLLHGMDDEILPPFCSEHVFARAGPLAVLRRFDGAKHGLDEVAEDVREQLMRWLLEKLSVSATNRG